MLNYYLQETSYVGTSLPEIEQSFREMAKMLRSKCDLDDFFKNSSFLETKVNKKDKLLNILFDYSSKIDLDVRNNLVGYVLDRIDNEGGPYASIEAFRSVPGKAHHFIGARFVNKKDYEINTYAEFLSKRENTMLTNISNENYPLFIPHMFKRVRFTEDGFDGLASVGNLGAVISDLKKLDNYTENHCTEGEFIMRNIRQEMGIDISGESESVHNNKKLRDLRYFFISPEIGWQYCYNHIKIGGDIRIYIHQDVREQKIYVPYVGEHLSTALHKC